MEQADGDLGGRGEMTNLQNSRLSDTVQRIYRQVPFYRNKLQALGLLPEDVAGIEDIGKLPFITKQDMRDNYPYGLFAVPLAEIVRVHASSGTTGKPTVVGYTKRDIGIWSEVMARALTYAGASYIPAFRWRMVMVCLPAVSGCITAQK